jgi:hypothetical protein
MDRRGACHNEDTSDSNPLKCHRHSLVVAVLGHLLSLWAEEMQHRIGHVAATSKNGGRRTVPAWFEQMLGESSRVQARAVETAGLGSRNDDLVGAGCWKCAVDDGEMGWLETCMSGSISC